MLPRTSRRQQREGLAHVAHTLERSLLPDALPAIEGLQLASIYRPATEGSEAGGDFYDVFPHACGCWLAVGDVCGKDADAAALTAMVRHSIRALAFQEESPAQVLRTVNDVMLSHQLSGRFATAILARIDLRGRASAATLASAGHPAPLLLRPDGDAGCPSIAGTLLGVLPRPLLRDLIVPLAPGSTIVLYTDGLTDAGAPDCAISVAELRDRLAAHPGSSPAEILRDLEDLALSRAVRDLRDDIAILAARVL